MDWILIIDSGATNLVSTTDGSIDIKNCHGFIVNDGTTKDVIMSLNVIKYYVYDPSKTGNEYVDKLTEISKEQASLLYDLISEYHGKNTKEHSLYLDKELIILYDEEVGYLPKGYIVNDGTLNKILKSMDIKNYYFLNKSELIPGTQDYVLLCSNYIKTKIKKRH